MASRLTIQAVDLGSEEDDDNPLSIAIDMGNVRLVERCLKDGWPLHLENKMGYSPLQQSASDGNMEIVVFLLRRGADPNAKNKWGITGLHRAAHNGHSDVVMLLLESGADVKSVNDGGNSALHWAAYFGHYQVCTMLLSEGADSLLKNKKGITPLEHAKGRKKLKCERILRSYAEGRMKPRKKISRKPAPKQQMEPVTDADLIEEVKEGEAGVQEEQPVTETTETAVEPPTYTEVVDMTVQPSGEFPETAEEEGKVVVKEDDEQEEVVVPDETKITITEASPPTVDLDITVVEAPFEATEEERLYKKLEIGDIGEKPEPLDMGELEDEPSQTLLPLRRKRQTSNQLGSNAFNTPRMTPRMKMFTPMQGATPAGDISRAESMMSVGSDRTVAYRNVDHKGDKLYSKTEIKKQYRGDYQTMVLELTALKAENMQLVKEGDVLTSEIQRYILFLN